MKAIILAAGRGSRMGNLTHEKPKCLLEIYGKPLIEHQIEALTKGGIEEIALVTGYKSELLQSYGNHHFHNDEWDKTNMVYSLLCAKEWLSMSDCIVSYADIYYTFEVIKDLVSCPDDIAISYDPNWLELWSKRFKNPLDDAETFKINQDGYLLEIGQKPKTVEEIQGQYMGLLKFNSSFFSKVQKNEFTKKISMTDFLSTIIKNKVSIKCIKNNTIWNEFDSASDLQVNV